MGRGVRKLRPIQNNGDDISIIGCSKLVISIMKSVFLTGFPQPLNLKNLVIYQF